MQDNLKQLKCLRVREVIEITGLSRTSLWRFSKSGQFPAPIKLSEKTAAWRYTDIETWLDNKTPPNMR